jgi:hypothetical protein
MTMNKVERDVLLNIIEKMDGSSFSSLAGVLTGMVASAKIVD